MTDLFIYRSLAKGGSTTVCGYLYYDSSVTYTNGCARWLNEKAEIANLSL